MVKNVINNIFYKDGERVIWLGIVLPKLIGYRNIFHADKYLSFLIKDDELLKNINQPGIKRDIILKKVFHGEQFYNKLLYKD